MKKLQLETLFPFPINSFFEVCRANPELKSVTVCENSHDVADAVTISDTVQLLKELIRVVMRCKALHSFVIRLKGRQHPSMEEIHQLQPLFDRLSATISIQTLQKCTGYAKGSRACICTSLFGQH